MPRGVGIDAGTVSLDLCGLDDGRVFLERSLPTRDAVANPVLVAGELLSAACGRWCGRWRGCRSR